MRIMMINHNKLRDYNCYDVNETVEKYNKGYFNKVAEVCTDDLEEAYSMSQNREGCWHNDDYVISYATKHEETRSTMVGDVFIKGEGINKEYYVVAGCGFKRLDGIDEFYE